MAWNPFKKKGGDPPEGARKPEPEVPEIPWIPATDNPWKVPVLDVRPVTQTMLSLSKDPKCAQNAVSFGRDDGTGFAGREPTGPARTTQAHLRFRRDRLVADGVLFIPESMEHKWAIFHHRGLLIFVRSWTRDIAATARLEQSGDVAEVTEIRGSFCFGESESADLTVRTLDYLVRSHVLGLVWPVPLERGQEADRKKAALFCMSMYGKLAWVATPHPVPPDLPEKPLRSHSLLHIAVAMGDTAGADAQLRSGVPVDLLAGDGLAPLHWALSTKGTSMIEFLLERGSPVDVPSAEGATPLMNAVQGGDIARLQFLLSRGADASARDTRGFTALHRAAEMGNVQVAELLLSRGADPRADAQGHSPLSLAEGRGHRALVKRLKG